MKISNFYFAFLLVSLLALLFSCNGTDDENNVDNFSDPEYIQRLTISLVPTTGGQPFTISFNDSDGPGNDPATYSSDALPIQASFVATIDMRDENGDIINFNKEETQIFFAVSAGLDLTFDYNDMDSNGNAIGLANEVETGNLPSSGDLSIVVKTKVNKPNTGVAVSTPGDVEIDVSIPVSTF